MILFVIILMMVRLGTIMIIVMRGLGMRRGLGLRHRTRWRRLPRLFRRTLRPRFSGTLRRRTHFLRLFAQGTVFTGRRRGTISG
jgi:hypothetical protein